MMDYSDTYLLALKVAAAGAIIVGGVGGFLTEVGPWYRSLRNPWWKPPDWAFGPIWTVILALATIAAAMVASAKMTVQIGPNAQSGGFHHGLRRLRYQGPISVKNPPTPPTVIAPAAATLRARR